MRPSMWKVVEALQEELMVVKAVAAGGVQDAASAVEAKRVLKDGRGYSSSSRSWRHGEPGTGADGVLGGRDGFKAGLVQDGCGVRETTPAMAAATATAGAGGDPQGPAAAAAAEKGFGSSPCGKDRVKGY